MSSPRPPAKVSIPAWPSRTLLPLLPVRRLARMLPVALMLASPVSTSSSRWLPRAKLTDE
ncbi:MAG TPA: hypothetical protein DIT03_15820 [Candidatus Accumulibacter sp.]|nr:hypothetical protein [Accumulibacter sp.]